MKKNHPTSLFTAFANHTARAAGHHVSFALAVLVISVWGVTGPIFGFSDTWQLIINTGTTIVTFLMVFLIQNTQNRDSTAMHLKLDEIIRAIDGAQNTLMDLEDLEDEDLQAIQKRYKALAVKAQEALEKDDIEEAAQHLRTLAAAKRSDSARTKGQAERKRKRS